MKYLNPPQPETDGVMI